MNNRPHLHFVTGRLAQQALRSVVEDLAGRVGFDYSIGVMPITVAALMRPAWIARHIAPPDSTTRVILPGACRGDLTPLTELLACPVEFGPRDLWDLPDYFGQSRDDLRAYGEHDIEIIAEINHAPRWDAPDLLREAAALARDGADWIDVGCEPGSVWTGVSDCVRRLRDQGHRVSVDSTDPREIELAVQAGAELVLSVNATNRERAADWGCQVVVIPDDVHDLTSFETTIELLQRQGVPMRLDPILEPIGIGLAASLGRYLEIRRRYPDQEMMMGIGNLTELTDVDSAGINVLLLGICQELGIRSVLTTQVINWARNSVRECDLGRRLVYHAVRQGRPPKHIEPRLVMLRDPKVNRPDADFLKGLAQQIKDANYRLFCDGERLHLISAGLHLQDENPFRLFQALLDSGPRNMDASHAFYLGYELAKATTALTLSKQYCQDEALDWGFLTIEETSHRKTQGAAKP